MGGLPRRLADRIVAQVALLRARRRLATAPVGELTARRGGAHAVSTLRPTSASQAGRAQALADAVRWTATHGLFRPYCLVRSLALQDLLRAEGIDGSEIRVGVRRDGGRLQAHAWVIWNGELLGDDQAHVSGFTEVDDITVLGTP